MIINSELVIATITLKDLEIIFGTLLIIVFFKLVIWWADRREAEK